MCKKLVELLEELNNYTYVPQPSNCYVITEPALREIYAAQFKDRIVQHFYMKEIEDVLESKLAKNLKNSLEKNIRGNIKNYYYI